MTATYPTGWNAAMDAFDTAQLQNGSKCEFYSDGDNNGEGAGWLETEQHTQTRALGYCGLAPLHRAPGP